MSPKAKVIIPNALTLSRLIFTPIIIALGITKNYKIALILVVIACITDMFDGKLARRWNTVTETGAKLDAICDKIFAIGLIACLLNKFSIFIPLIVLEVIIGLFNLFIYYKIKKTKSLMIGKIKTTFLFITISLGFSTLFTNIFIKVIPGFAVATLNIQILTFISYIVYFYDTIKNKQIEETIVKDKEETRTKVYDIEEEEKKKKQKKEPKEFSSDTKILKNLKDIFLDED
ncbi:MAG: CDP-alcohol phosphatidyltransferase family protein [Lactobacillales bacterium]|nr:CDP-alcohol phosphatidyltransferase family protein [Lactobacillales bacterium]